MHTIKSYIFFVTREPGEKWTAGTNLRHKWTKNENKGLVEWSTRGCDPQAERVALADPRNNV